MCRNKDSSSRKHLKQVTAHCWLPSKVHETNIPGWLLHNVHSQGRRHGRNFKNLLNTSLCCPFGSSLVLLLPNILVISIITYTQITWPHQCVGFLFQSNQSKFSVVWRFTFFSDTINETWRFIPFKMSINQLYINVYIHQLVCFGGVPSIFWDNWV